MATNPRKRQQKVERKAAKRKEKKQLTPSQTGGLADRLRAAEKYPILHGFLTETLWDQGIGYAVLSRELPSGMIVVGVFMVDRFCLGVKDCHATILPRSIYEDKYLREMGAQSDLRHTSAAAVRKFVESAVAYAADLGFPPHADYQKVRLIFGDINAEGCTETFEFGKDGKPFFIAGPFDTPSRCKLILTTLLDRCGADGFEYLIPSAVGDLFSILPQKLKERGPRLLTDSDLTPG